MIFLTKFLTESLIIVFKRSLQLSPRNFLSLSKLKYDRPFFNDLFVNRLNLDFIDYPELESFDQMLAVNKIKSELSRLINNSDLIGEKLKDETIQKILKQSIIPRELNGFQLNKLQLVKLIESNYKSLLPPHKLQHFLTVILADLVDNDRLSVNPCLGKDLTERGLFCWNEENNRKTRDVITVETRAELSPDLSSYRINGVKTNLINIDQLEHFFVLASIDDGSQSPKFGVFFVHRNDPGVSFTQSDQQIFNLPDVPSLNLVLSNVVVPLENLIVEPDKGKQIIEKFIISENLIVSAVALGMIREMFDRYVRFVNQREVFGVPLLSYEKIKIEVSEFGSEVYFFESAVYYLAGVLDGHPNQDWLVESVLSKTFCSETLFKWINLYSLLVGQNELNEDFLREMNRDGRYLSINQRSDVINRFYAATRCTDHFVSNINFINNSPVKNVLCHFGLSPDIVCSSTNSQCKPTLTNYIDPTIKSPAIHLFKDLRKLTLVMQSLYMKHGEVLVRNEYFLYGLSEMMLQVLVIISGLSRVSRVISLRLPTFDIQSELFLKFFSDFNAKFSKNIGRFEKTITEKLSKESQKSTDSVGHRNGLFDKHPHPFDI